MTRFITTLALFAIIALASFAQAAPLDRTLVVDAVQQAATRNLPETVVSVEVHNVVLRGQLDVPEGAAVSVRIRAAGDEDWVGRMSASALVQADGKQIGSVPITAEVAPYIEVPVLRLPISRGQAIGAEHLSAGRREAGSLPAGIVREAESLLGRVARKDLGLNQVVRASDLEKAVDARRNRSVTLLLQRGQLKIVAPGVLRRDAMIGDLVQVLSVTTRSLVYGTLVSPDLVLLPTVATASSASQSLRSQAPSSDSNAALAAYSENQ